MKFIRLIIRLGTLHALARHTRECACSTIIRRTIHVAHAPMLRAIGQPKTHRLSFSCWSDRNRVTLSCVAAIGRARCAHRCTPQTVRGGPCGHEETRKNDIPLELKRGRMVAAAHHDECEHLAACFCIALAGTMANRKP